MYYKIKTIQDYLEAKDSFYVKSPVEVSNILKSLPENLALKIIYGEIADVLINLRGKDKMVTIASVSSEYGLTIPQNPIEVRDNVNKYLEIEQETIEKSIEVLLKSASLEDGIVDSIDVNKEEYEFIKQDFLEREKYELINKMKLS